MNQDKKRFLIVDDDDAQRMLLAEMLQAAGYELVGEAENGQIGLDMLKVHKPDVVLLDVNMPVMDGLATLVEMIKIDSEVRVIMLTSVAKGFIWEECWTEGAYDHIRKDSSMDEILATIRKVCAGEFAPR
jgi:two-component system, chemotaxis family, chemotaxis protein CheY